jgi:hypothetical protein
MRAAETRRPLHAGVQLATHSMLHGALNLGAKISD